MIDAFLGIDPGAKGAAAIMNREGRPLTLFDCPEEAAVTNGWIETWIKKLHIRAVGLETVNERPGISAKAIGGLKRSIALWEGLLVCHHLRLFKVTPRTWRKGLVLPSDGPNPKTRSLVVARRLFPDQFEFLKHKGDNNRANALLIAEYIRRAFLHGKH